MMVDAEGTVEQVQSRKEATVGPGRKEAGGEGRCVAIRDRVRAQAVATAITRDAGVGVRARKVGRMIADALARNWRCAIDVGYRCCRWR